MWCLCESLSKLFEQEPASYAGLYKKDDDRALEDQKTVKIWIKSHPVNPNLGEMSTRDICVYVSNLIQTLNSISLDHGTINDVSAHLRKIAAQSERARKEIIAKSANLRCDKNFISEIRDSAILTCTNKP